MTKALKRLALILLMVGLAVPAFAWDDWSSDDGWGDNSDDWSSDDDSGDDWDSAPAPAPAASSTPAPRYMSNPMNRNQIIHGIIDNINAPDRWQNSPKSVFWEDYRGNNVRIEMLRTNSDMKEIRLKFVQTANVYSNPDSTVAEMLSRVAARTMKRVCGRRALSASVLYERPGTEYMRTTMADPFLPASGNTLIEYGFRCVY